MTKLVDAYYDGLVYYLNTYVRNFSLAEELAEDTFVRLAVKRPHFSGHSAFKTWLYAIGRNLAVDRMRREKHRADLPLEETALCSAYDEIAVRYAQKRKPRFCARRCKV